MGRGSGMVGFLRMLLVFVNVLCLGSLGRVCWVLGIRVDGFGVGVWVLWFFYGDLFLWVLLEVSLKFS